MADDIRYMTRSSFNGILPVERITSTYQAIESAIKDYLTINSRLFSSFTTMMLLRFPIIFWRILNSLLITLSLYFSLKLIKPKGFNTIKDLIINTIIVFAFFALH